MKPYINIRYTARLAEANKEVFGNTNNMYTVLVGLKKQEIAASEFETHLIVSYNPNEEIWMSFLLGKIEESLAGTPFLLKDSITIKSFSFQNDEK